MRILEKSEFNTFKDVHLGKVKQGGLFIYPTDTIYRIGCDATNGEAIEKIRSLKMRPNQPLSVIAPSKTWIQENCVMNNQAEEWLDKLPGPYTLVLELKKDAEVHPSYNKKDKTIGVMIPNHWIADTVAEFGKPIITTSPNIHGETVMHEPNHLDETFRPHVDFMVYEGELHNPASAVVKLTEEEPQFLRTR
jgi:L-threonylcarbamoyladenylate synthase